MPDHTDPCSQHADRVDEAHAEIRAAFAVFAGKWKLEILWLLSQRMHRFNELKRAIPGVTQHMLTQQLRELENDGVVRRTVYPEIPPRVEYEITEDARRLRPVFEAIFAWSRQRGAAPGAEDAAA
ncbi:winged helix-turn-helix transcriptional regulator [Lysobacter enzymogenes]|uniref:winged helix-turn-helix transcriptional regulator n=1 Tax=Lysobacter enzymogenes TaxID=69 RepID=UPI003851585E